MLAPQDLKQMTKLEKKIAKLNKLAIEIDTCAILHIRQRGRNSMKKELLIT